MLKLDNKNELYLFMSFGASGRGADLFWLEWCIKGVPGGGVAPTSQ